jgi:aryl-alcohol dehydrogenase-like predicted oxidoreductase
MYAWQFSKALHVAEKHGWARFVSRQNHLTSYTAKRRGKCWPALQDEGIGVIPYSPLAEEGSPATLTSLRSARKPTRSPGKNTAALTMADKPVRERLTELAKQRGLARSQKSARLAASESSRFTAPIIGVTKTRHLDDAVAALSVKLSPEEVVFLEEPYIPHRVVGAL